MKKISLFCLLILLHFIAQGAVTIDDPWKQAQDLSYFAMNGSKVFHVPDQMDASVKQRIEWMKELGVLWDRSDWWWHVIEPQKGKFDFSLPDRIVKRFEEEHVQIYPILCYGSSWWKDRNTPLSDQDYEDFGNYVFETVNRYKDHFTYWSVWNEPNIVPFWTPEPNPDDYARLLKIAYTQAKKADPDCKICAPVIAPLGAWDKKFTERLFQLQCLDYIDVFDYHYYRNNPPEDEVPDEIADIKAFMRRFGEEKPIWISESGVSGYVEDKEAAYKKQAALMARNQLLALSCGVKRFFYFDLQNWNDKPGESWDSKLGLVEAGGMKKPSFHAYKTMVKEVDYKKFVGRIRRPEEGWDGVLIFDPKRREFILAAWCAGLGNTKKLDFFCEPVDVKIVHPYGEVEMRPLEEPPTPEQFTRAVSVEIDQNPRFIHSVDPFIYLHEAGTRLSPEKIAMNPGETVGFRLQSTLVSHPSDIENMLPPEISIIKKNIPKGLEWDQKNGGLTASNDISPGLKTLSATIRAQQPFKFDRRTHEFKTSAIVEILPLMTLELRPFMDNRELNAQVSIVNQSSRDLKGNIRIVDAASASDIFPHPDSVTIQKGTTWKQDLPLDISLVQKYENPAQWNLRFQDRESRPFHIHVSPLADQAPVIDGSLDDWKDVKPLVINRKEQMTRGAESWNPNDASGEVYFRFTPDLVCVAARVTDDDPVFNPSEPKFLWKGDALEIYLGFEGPARRTVLNKKYDFQIGVAPTCSLDKPIVFLFHEDRILEEAKVEARKTDNGYILEASIPLKEFGEVKLSEGTLLGLDAAINDLDKVDWAPAGNDPGCALMWNGTIRNWIDPSNWGMTILREKP
ncbi:beta-galactosidase [Candidatus Sumerlaeota bacterium]|nr:beta-galactosidase [Candidatus Sumerlaeota bacterium]